MTELVATGVGQELADARSARGLALVDVAQQLKFAPRQLEALEQERFDALPGGTFARGMVRSYARLLKIDPEPLVERIAGRFNAPAADQLAARYHQPVPFSDSARRSTFAYLGLSIGVLVIVGVLAYEWHSERTAAAKKPAKSAVLAKAEPREAAPEPASAPEPAPVPATVKAEKVAAAVPAQAVRSGPGRIVVRTQEEAWIEIRDSADRLLVSSLHPAGAERAVRGKPPYSLVIGNVSSVSVSYDEKPVDLAPLTRAGVARFTLP